MFLAFSMVANLSDAQYVFVFTLQLLAKVPMTGRAVLLCTPKIAAET
jgi:hypothetical protein